MGLVDSQREYYMARRNNLRGGRRQVIFFMIFTIIMTWFAHRENLMFFYWLSGIFIVIWIFVLGKMTDEIHQINEILEEKTDGRN